MFTLREIVLLPPENMVIMFKEPSFQLKKLELNLALLQRLIRDKY
jgi:hypothetical protein